jgi:MFS family permease
MNALAAGGFLLVYFVGNLGIKPFTSPILQRFGFRNVLVINGCLAGTFIILCTLLKVDTARWVIVVTLLLAGATRSMQLTCLNTLAFADTTPAQRSSSATLFNMSHQVAGVLGVALSTLVLNFALLNTQLAQAGMNEIRLGFVFMGAVAILSALVYLKLPADAGAEVSGRRA